MIGTIKNKVILCDDSSSIGRSKVAGMCTVGYMRVDTVKVREISIKNLIPVGYENLLTEV